MKYIVHYIERIGRSFIVDADTCIDAMDKVKNRAETWCFGCYWYIKGHLSKCVD